jgi:hypothetical protein
VVKGIAVYSKLGLVFFGQQKGGDRDTSGKVDWNQR